MTSADKPKFAERVLAIAGAWIPPQVLTPAQVELAFAALADIPFDLVMAGLELAVKRCRHFPTAADIRASLDIAPTLKAELIRRESQKAGQSQDVTARLAFVAKALRGPTDPYSLNEFLKGLADFDAVDVMAALDATYRCDTWFPSLGEFRGRCELMKQDREDIRRQALLQAAEDWAERKPSDAPQVGKTAAERALDDMRAILQPGGQDLFKKTTICGCGMRVYAAPDGAVREFWNLQEHRICLPPGVTASQPKSPFCGYCEDTGFQIQTCVQTLPCRHCRAKGFTGDHRFVAVCGCRAVNPVWQKHFEAQKRAVETRQAPKAKSKALTPRGQSGWTKVGGDE